MFYVYEHRVNGKVIYVGCGGLKRPYDMIGRSRRWFHCVGNKEVDIRIIEEHQNRSDALKKESEMINAIKPEANLRRRSAGRVSVSVRVSESDLEWLTREGEAMRLSGAHVAGVVLAEAVAERRKGRR